MFGTGTIISIIIWLLVFGGAYLLQTRLAKQRSKLWGLILPSAFFAVSIGIVIENALRAFRFGFSPGAFIALIILLLLLNIPTILLWIVYKNIRKNLAKNDELSRMNIQDL